MIGEAKIVADHVRYSTDASDVALLCKSNDVLHL